LGNNEAEIHAYADVHNNSSEDWVNIQLKLIATELQIVKKNDPQQQQQQQQQQQRNNLVQRVQQKNIMQNN